MRFKALTTMAVLIRLKLSHNEASRVSTRPLALKGADGFLRTHVHLHLPKA